MSNSDTVKTDVLIIGGGPSGLATAIRLSDLFGEKGLKKRILLIDKGSSVGSHIISGAVIKPDIFKALLPDVKWEEIPLCVKVTKDYALLLGEKSSFKVPFPVPYMGNKGNYVISLSQLCRYLAKVAEEKGVEIYPGFSVNEILYDEEGKVKGAKTIDTGVNNEGVPQENYQAGTEILASVTVFAEGTRGTLAKQLIKRFDLSEGKNPQIYSLGCKELWSVPEGNIKAGEIFHTMGYPLNLHEFGGGFVYGLPDNKVALGLVIGLDYPDPTFDVHDAFQIWKTHPSIRKVLKGGHILEYGAKTLPEGGYYSLPKLYVDHALIVGDSAGFLAMPALKGVHLAACSGILAAETILAAFEKNDFSADTLKYYEDLVGKSLIHKELYPVRNFRQAFAGGMIKGGIHFATQILTGGAGLFGRLKSVPDSEATKKLKDFRGVPFKERFRGKFDFDKVITFDKVTDVYYSGVNHDEEQVPHLHVNNPDNYNPVNIGEYGAPCQYFCSAEVYEVHTDKNGNKSLRIHYENCLHCKTCDIKEPGDGITWMLPNGGNGPEYNNM